MSVPFDLTCWYLNLRRVAEVTGTTSVDLPRSTDPHAARTVHLVQMKNGVVAWMKANRTTPLEVLLAEGNLAPGAIFTHHSNYFFSGLSEVEEARRKGRAVKHPATAYTKLDGSNPFSRLMLEFSDEHMVSASSWHELAGEQRKFVLGLVTDVQGDTIRCVPYVIGNVLNPHSGVLGDGGP